MLDLLKMAWGVALTLVFVEAARILLVRLRGLRLTNWFGYLLAGAFLAGVPALQYYLAWWLPLLLLPAVLWVLLEVRATLRRWRSGAWVPKVALFGVPAAQVRPRVMPRRAA